MKTSETFLLSFLVQGFLVLSSYYIYAPKKDIWGVLSNPVVFCVWCVTASLSALGFIVFSIMNIMSISTSADADEVYEWTLFPYSIFQSSASLYMPLAKSGYKVATLFSLFVAAVATGVMVFSSVVLYGASAITILMGVLFFHCTVIDFFMWGYSFWTMEL